MGEIFNLIYISLSTMLNVAKRKIPNPMLKAVSFNNIYIIWFTKTYNIIAIRIVII